MNTGSRLLFECIYCGVFMGKFICLWIDIDTSYILIKIIEIDKKNIIKSL